MNRLFFTKSHHSRKLSQRSGRRGFRPMVEALEDRRVLSPVAFALDPNASQLTLSGRVNDGAIQEQGPGSLTTQYNGTINTDLADDLSTIQFLADGTAANAQISGQWSPLSGGADGTADANYGGKSTFHVPIGIFNVTVNADVAVRELVFTASSGPLPLDGSAAPSYAFPANGITFKTTAGFADYKAVPSIGSTQRGRADISNQSAQNQSTDNGTVLDNGDGTFTLTVPVKITISQTITFSTPFGTATVTVTLNIMGTLQGTSSSGGGGGGGGAGAFIAGNSAYQGVFTTTGDFAGSNPRVESAANGDATPSPAVQNSVPSVSNPSLVSPFVTSSSGRSAAELAAIDEFALDLVQNGTLL
jgi:hypothetical protein